MDDDWFYEITKNEPTPVVNRFKELVETAQRSCLTDAGRIYVYELLLKATYKFSRGEYTSLSRHLKAPVYSENCFKIDRQAFSRDSYAELGIRDIRHIRRYLNLLEDTRLSIDYIDRPICLIGDHLEFQTTASKQGRFDPNAVFKYPGFSGGELTKDQQTLQPIPVYGEPGYIGVDDGADIRIYGGDGALVATRKSGTTNYSALAYDSHTIYRLSCPEYAALRGDLSEFWWEDTKNGRRYVRCTQYHVPIGDDAGFTTLYSCPYVVVKMGQTAMILAMGYYANIQCGTQNLASIERLDDQMRLKFEQNGASRLVVFDGPSSQQMIGGGWFDKFAAILGVDQAKPVKIRLDWVRYS